LHISPLQDRKSHLMGPMKSACRDQAFHSIGPVGKNLKITKTVNNLLIDQ